MRAYSYIIYSDSGFAPNPFHGWCTLATCKPTIRLAAQPGEWILATGSKHNVATDRLVYAMLVAEAIPLELYYEDSRFFAKRVTDPESAPECCGDNIYFVGKDGNWHRDPSSFRHAEPRHVLKDIGGRNVLAGREFYYFGREAIPMPWQFTNLIHVGDGDIATLNDGEVPGSFVTWLRGSFAAGRHGDPWELITRTTYGKPLAPMPILPVKVGEDAP